MIAVGAAAPAIAASCSDGICTSYTIDWDSTSRYTRNPSPSLRETSVTGTYALPLNPLTFRKSGLNTLTMTMTSTYAGNMRSGVTNESSSGLSFTENLTITNGVRDPGAAWSFGNALQLHQQVRGAGTTDISTGSYSDRQTITFTFSEPLCYFEFTIWDLDRIDYRSVGTNDFGDTVAITSASAYTVTKGSQVQGAGTATDPFRSTDGSDNTITDPAASVKVVFPNGVTSFTFEYWNDLPYNFGGRPAADGDQRIFLSDMVASVWESQCRG